MENKFEYLPEGVTVELSRLPCRDLAVVTRLRLEISAIISKRGFSRLKVKSYKHSNVKKSTCTPDSFINYLYGVFYLTILQNLWKHAGLDLITFFFLMGDGLLKVQRMGKSPFHSPKVSAHKKLPAVVYARN